MGEQEHRKGAHFIIKRYRDGDEIPIDLLKTQVFKSFRYIDSKDESVLEVWYVSDGNLGRVR